MKKHLLVICILCAVKISYSQNLVPNPSFEDTIHCPDYISELDYATGWHTLVNTPDYYNECNNTSKVNAGMVGVPMSARGYQTAHTGVAFAGEVNYYTAQTDYRETFYAQLLSPLSAGMTYDVGMWVVMDEDHAQWAVDGDLGIYLSSTIVNSSQLFTYTPQISNPHGNVLNDTLNWTKISGNYTAIGGEQYITIGSLIRDNQLTIIDRGGSYPFTSYAIDDVWVIPQDVTTSNEISEEGLLSAIYPNPASNELRVSCKGILNNETTIELYNILGKNLYRATIGGNDSKDETVIDISAFPKGVYFVQLNSGKKISRMKFIKD